MADPFNEMKKLDEESLERDAKILVKAALDNRDVDFEQIHRTLRAFTLTRPGISESAAQARATLILERAKKLAADEAEKDPRVKAIFDQLDDPTYRPN